MLIYIWWYIFKITQTVSSKDRENIVIRKYSFHVLKSSIDPQQTTTSNNNSNQPLKEWGAFYFVRGKLKITRGRGGEEVLKSFEIVLKDIKWVNTLLIMKLNYNNERGESSYLKLVYSVLFFTVLVVKWHKISPFFQ